MVSFLGGGPGVALRRCVEVWPERDGREGSPWAKEREQTKAQM